MTLAAFEEPAYRDAALRPLMNRIRVHLDDEVDALYPKTISMKLKATTIDGRLVGLWPRALLGHPNKPMGDNDVKTKFRQTVEPVYGKNKTEKILQQWWDLKDMPEAELVKALAALDV